MKTVNVKKTIEHLKRVLYNHTHLPVDNDLAGFMTPEMLFALESSKGNFIKLGTVDDFLKLENGNYEAVGTETNNAPRNSGIFLVSVSGNEGRKRIIAQHSFSGRIYTYSVHTNGVSEENPSGWRRLYQTKEIFSGSAKEVNDVIELQDNMNQFIYFDVCYAYLGTYHTQKIPLSAFKNSFDITALNLTNNMTDCGMSYTETSVNRIDDFKLKIIRAKSCYNHMTSDSKGEMNNDRIDIYRIIGYF